MKKMKTHALTLVLTISLVSAFTMCKKETRTCSSPSTSQSLVIDKNGMIEKKGLVPSVDYKLSDKENYDLVKAFKQRKKSAARTGGGGAPDSLRVDSAQYMLESSLNFDFDAIGGDGMLDIHSDVATYSFNLDAASRAGYGYLLSSELNMIYDQLRTYYAAMVNTDTKIAAIDVEAFIDDDSGQGHFEVTATVMKTNAITGLYRCTSNIWSPTTNYAGCTSAQIATIFGSCSTGFPAGLTGVSTRFQAELNCSDKQYIGCLYGYWYPVVNNCFYIPTGMSDTKLYQGPSTTAFNYCSGAASTLQTGASFNSKLANTKVYMPAYIASIWPTQSLIGNSATIIPQNTVGSSGPIIYWLLKFQRGVRTCRPAPNQ